MKTKNIKFIVFFLIVFSVVLGAQHCWAAQTKDYAVQINATAQTSPAKITLSWIQDTAAVPTNYTVSRKLKGGTSWSLLVTLPGTTLTYEDTTVSVGSAYEYQIAKAASGYSGYGYIFVGLDAPLVDSRGKLVLLVDNTFSADLKTELDMLEQDLAGDGWQILRHDVSRTDTVPHIKSIIKADYTADPSNVKSVYIFGHVPVPYSGDINPDGHPDHLGAWPADAYYGDMDGSWTDTSINDSTASDVRNKNIPGDGKFDNSMLPTDVELAVGRVDLSNITVVPGNPSELELLRRYIVKEHNFRRDLVNLNQKGLVGDNFGVFSGEAFAQGGWRNFASFFGAENVSTAASGAFVSSLTQNSFLWAYGCGGGSYTSAGGIGTTTDIVSNPIKAEFFMLFGSYFGDWDKQNNFLRSVLAAPDYGLADAWSGRPNWFFHHMALGETIGYDTRLSQNNSSLYRNTGSGARYVHSALMGDPTLRMHIVDPVSNLSGQNNNNDKVLSWTASSDSVVGYHVYRASTPLGPYTRLTSSPITGTSYTDANAASGDFTYMVRAIKKENTNSGTYFNSSEGIFYPDWVTNPPTDTNPPVLSAAAPSGALAAGTTQTNLSLTTNENATCKYATAGSTAYDSMPNTFSTTGTNTHQTLVTGLVNGNTYNYYVRCKDNSNNINSSDYPISFSVAAPAPPPPLKSDLNQDSKVDVNDFNILKIDFLKTTSQLANPLSDVDGDGQATIEDVGILMSEWR